jgi:hypothetical protein
MHSQRRAFPVVSAFLGLGLSLCTGSDLETLYSLLYDYSRLLIDVERSSLYLALPGQQQITKRDLVSGHEEATIALSLTPTDAAMTPDGRWLFVGETRMSPQGVPLDDPGRIAEIDLQTFTLVRELDYPYSPRGLIARDDRVLVVGNSDPFRGANEVRLFDAVSAELTGSQVAHGLNLTLDVSQQSFFCFGLGNRVAPNVRATILTNPLRFGGRRIAPDENMVHEVYGSPDGELLACGGTFYRGAPGNVQDLTLLHVPETARSFGGSVTRFKPPAGQTFLMTGYGLAFFRRDLLEAIAIVSFGGDLVLDAAYLGDRVYAVALRQGFETVRIVRLSDPAVGWEENQPPVAAFAWSPESPTDRDDVRLDGGLSTDDQRTAGNLRFRWDFDSDGVWETDWSADAITFHRFRGAGVQRVTLEVRDRYGVSAQVTRSFGVAPVPDPGTPFGTNDPWTIPLRSTSMVFDPVRPVLYAANLTNQSLIQLDLISGQISRWWQLDAAVCGLGIRPDGSRLYVGLTTNDLTFPDARGNGWIADFDLIQGRKERAFSVRLEPEEIAATDAGGILVFGESTPYHELHLYEGSEGRLITALRLDAVTRLALHPGQAVVYAAADGIPSVLRRCWVSPDTGLLMGPTEAAYWAGGRVFPLLDGTHLITALGTLLTASPVAGPTDDMGWVRDLGLGSVTAVLPLADRGLVGLIRGTGRATNDLIFLWDDLETELLRVPVDTRVSEMGRHGDRYYLAGSTRTNTWVESRRIPARTVEENLAPRVTLHSPVEGQVVLRGSTVSLHATADDEDGIVSGVRFFANEQDLGDPAVPWCTVSWQPQNQGRYQITAIAEDNLGVTSRTPPVTLVVNAPPSVWLDNPAAGTTLVSPANFRLEAEAHDPDGEVVEVEFFYRPHRGLPVSLGLVTAAPYHLEVRDFVGMDGQLEAWARDDLGASAQAFRPLRILGSIGDDIRRPLPWEGVDGVARTNNFAAGTQFFEDFRFALSPAPERTLWWEWQAPGAGVLTCSTRGSTFDAQLLLVRGVDLAALQWLIGSWQRPDFALGRRLKLPVEAGTRYLIGVLAFWPADPGLVTLELAWEPVLGESVDPPVNDRLNQRIRLTGSPVSVAGSNRGATRETVDPLPSLPALAGPGRSVWWGWTAPAAGVCRVSTEGSDFDTTLSVLVESQPGVWTMLGSNDDATPYQLTSQFLLEATEGREYAIMVDGFGGHTGSINLRIESALEGGPPSNDDFRNRQALSGALSLVQGTTFQATSEPGEPTNPLS